MLIFQRDFWKVHWENASEFLVKLYELTREKDQ